MPTRPQDDRSAAREAALQMLYALEMGGQTAAEVERWYIESHPLEPAVRDRAGRLLDHAVAHRERIEALIDSHARGWKRDRIAPIDRGLLLLAIGEMLEDRHPPIPVIIHEAIRLVKKYSQPETVSFIHGLLDAVARELRPPRNGEKPSFSFRD